jgi:hypothetical protein
MGFRKEVKQLFQTYVSSLENEHHTLDISAMKELQVKILHAYDNSLTHKGEKVAEILQPTVFFVDKHGNIVFPQ